MELAKMHGASSFEEAFFSKSGTYIHPTAQVGKNVFLDENVKVGPFTVIVGNVIIESGTRLYSSNSIGFPAQHTGTRDPQGSVHIKTNCEIREFVSIHASKFPQGKTEIGNNCYIMNYSHISHDTILEDNVILINSVNLAGHTYVEKNVMLMANSAAHQFCRIGQYAALSPFSGIRQDLPPYCLFEGQPARFAGLNIVALRRAGLTIESRNALKKVTGLFYHDKLPLDVIIQQGDLEGWCRDEHVQKFLNFIKNSSRGVSRRSFDTYADAQQHHEE